MRPSLGQGSPNSKRALALSPLGGRSRRELSRKTPSRAARNVIPLLVLSPRASNMRAMFLPDWIVDDVLAPADPSAIRVVLALFRHGSLQVAGDGSQRVYWRGGRVQLGRVSHQSKRSVDAAIAALRAAGFVTLHTPREPTHGIALSVPLSRPGERATVAPAEEGSATDAPTKGRIEPVRRAGVAPRAIPEAADMHDGDDPDPSFSHFDCQETTITTMTREEMFSRLAEEGVSNPASWLAKFDHARIEAALDRLDEAYERDELAAGPVQHYGDVAPVRRSITNPPGFLYDLLRGGANPGKRAAAAHVRAGADGIVRYG